MNAARTPMDIAATVPEETIAWLTSADNPAVAALTRQRILGEGPSAELEALWARRNEHGPVARILELMQPDGSWAAPARDYQKYWGSLWQVHFLGELYADGGDARVQQAAAYAFSRQLPDGSWSASNARAAGSIPCLTANVGRALARLGHASDERVAAGIAYCVELFRELGCPNCRQGAGSQLNGYCHMVTPKILLYLAEVPEDLWPDGAYDLRDDCIRRLRDKEVFRCLPAESHEFQDLYWSTPSGQRQGLLERFLAEHPTFTYGPKTGWLRFGYPLSYNSDVLEALAALAAHGEPRRREYEGAIEVVERAADPEMRWTLRNTFNGRMLVDVEKKGAPSKWLTFRALDVLQRFANG